MVELSTAIPADETGSVVPKVLPQGKINIRSQKEIAYEIERGEAEDDIVDGTDGSQSAQIYHGLA